MLTLSQDKTSGALSLVKYHNVDTSGVHGLWITCGASLSPWGTHLSSEEYEPDATTIASNTQFQAFSQNLYGSTSAANPYHYGHMPEVTVNPDGTGRIVKHYGMGGISHELVQVMPDERTVLMGDDATDGGLFMFVADAARDLSAGTLYVAQWTLSSTASGGAGTLRWIKLGHATSDAIEALADTLTAADIVDVQTSDPQDASYTAIHYNGATQWVKFVAGRELAAAFLETHRYAAYKGGSMVFTKMEGTTVNAKDKELYSAMSAIRSSLKSRLNLDAKVEAGAVYALNMTGGQSDTDSNAIDSAWVPVDMAAVPALIGQDLATADATGNKAAIDKIANPDNLKFSEAMRTLTRLLSCPAGAESTGLHAVDDANGFAYIMSNFQHAGDLPSSVPTGLATQLSAAVNANYSGGKSAAVGYLTGLLKSGDLVA